MLVIHLAAIALMSVLVPGQSLLPRHEADRSSPITPNGMGPIRIGMSRARVESALGKSLVGEAIESEYDCIELAPIDSEAEPDLYFMFERRKLTRISITRNSSMKTPRGIGILAPTADVIRAYGSKLVSEPHAYEDKPARYLTYWISLNRRGVRFEIGSNGTVQTIHAGEASIEYAEGCA